MEEWLAPLYDSLSSPRWSHSDRSIRCCAWQQNQHKKLRKPGKMPVISTVFSQFLHGFRHNPTLTEPLTHCIISTYSREYCAPVAQWLEQRTHNPLVGGSSPSGRTIYSSVVNRRVTAIYTVEIRGRLPGRSRWYSEV